MANYKYNQQNTIVDSRRLDTTCPSMLSDAGFPTTSPKQLNYDFVSPVCLLFFLFSSPFFFTNSFLNYASDAAVLGMKHDLKIGPYGL